MDRSFKSHMLGQSFNRLYCRMDDHCVYARSVLGRLTSTFTSSYASEGQFSDASPSTPSSMQPLPSTLDSSWSQAPSFSSSYSLSAIKGKLLSPNCSDTHYPLFFCITHIHASLSSTLPLGLGRWEEVRGGAEGGAGSWKLGGREGGGI